MNWETLTDNGYEWEGPDGLTARVQPQAWYWSYAIFRYGAHVRSGWNFQLLSEAKAECEEAIKKLLAPRPRYWPAWVSKTGTVPTQREFVQLLDDLMDAMDRLPYDDGAANKLDAMHAALQIAYARATLDHEEHGR